MKRLTILNIEGAATELGVKITSENGSITLPSIQSLLAVVAVSTELLDSQEIKEFVDDLLKLALFSTIS